MSIDNSDLDIDKLRSLLVSNDPQNVELAFVIGENFPAFQQILQELTVFWETVDLEGRQEITPKEIMRMTRWHMLNLRSLQLKELPKEIQLFKNLSKLNLTNNSLSQLPVELSKLSKLQYLNLSQNAFEHIPAILNQLTSIQEINFSNNQLSQLPSFLDHFKSLQRLYFAHNQLNCNYLNVFKFFIFSIL